VHGFAHIFPLQNHFKVAAGVALNINGQGQAGNMAGLQVDFDSERGDAAPQARGAYT